MKKFSIYVGAICAVVMLLSSSAIIAQNRMAGSEPETLVTVQNRVLSETQNVQQLQTEAESKITQMRANMQKIMANIRDEQKQRMANQISEQITRLNKVWTDHFTSVLNKLDLALQKIETRTDKAKTNGKDISMMNIAIQSAKTSIEVARKTVATQATNTYIVDTTIVQDGLSSPSAETQEDQDLMMKNLKSQFRATRDQLQKDISTLRDGVVKDARNSVKNALETLSQIPGVDNEPGQK